MKKLFLILLILLTAFSTAFAITYSGPNEVEEDYLAIGISSGFNQLVAFGENGNNTTRNIVPVKIDITEYMGSNFAINMGAGMDIYLPYANYNDTDFGFTADILFYLNLPIANTLNFLIGGGFGYKALFAYYNGISYTDNYIAVLGSVRIDMKLLENMLFFVSGDVGYNFLNIATAERKGWWTNHYSEEVYGTSFMPWSVEAGVSFVF